MISSVLMTQSSHFDDYPIQNTIFTSKSRCYFGPTILKTLKIKRKNKLTFAKHNKYHYFLNNIVFDNLINIDK